MAWKLGLPRRPAKSLRRIPGREHLLRGGPRRPFVFPPAEALAPASDPLLRAAASADAKACMAVWQWDAFILLGAEANRAIFPVGICWLVMVVLVDREDR